MYKKLLLPVFFILYFSSLMLAQSAEAMLKRGNEFYQAKDFDKAIEAYETLVEQGFEGTELFYNLGNAYYRIGKLGYAILFYEKALKLTPSDEDVRHNLALANIKTVDNIETLPKFFIFQWWESLLAMFSVSGWTVIAYIFYIQLLAVIVFYVFVKEPVLQKYSVYWGLVSVILFIFTIAVLTVNLNRETKVKKGIVVEHTVTAKLSPDNKSSDAFVIHEGLKVNVEDKVNNWLKIRLQDGKLGWLENHNLRMI